MRLHLVTGLGGGAGRSLTAALLANGLRLRGRRVVLVQQSFGQLLSRVDQIDTVPVPGVEVPLTRPIAGRCGRSRRESFRSNIALGTRDPFVADLDAAARTVKGGADEIVVDLTPVAAALTVDLLRAASTVLVPLRPSPLEIEAAVRTVTRLTTIQHMGGTSVPVLFAAIAPDDERSRQAERLVQALDGYDPDGEVRDVGTAGLVVDVPWLSDELMMALHDEKPVWDDPGLAAACRAFASSVIEAGCLARAAEGSA